MQFKTPGRKLRLPVLGATCAVGILGATIWVSQSQASTAEPGGAPFLPSLESTMVACRDLTSADEVVRDREKNTVLDEEKGLLQITYYAKSGREKTVTIEYRDDEECKKFPEFPHIIAHAVEANEEATQSRCPQLKKMHTDSATKEVKAKGKTINREALGKYLAEKCSR